jgi:hypothetical protein
MFRKLRGQEFGLLFRVEVRKSFLRAVGQQSVSFGLADKRIGQRVQSPRNFALFYWLN